MLKGVFGGQSDSVLTGVRKVLKRNLGKNVFPFEEEADAVFNTTLVYELSILKTYAEPLLYAVEENDENYKDVVRLLNLLKLVLPISSENIPRDSIIREFIGNSIFK